MVERPPVEGKAAGSIPVIHPHDSVIELREMLLNHVS